MSIQLSTAGVTLNYCVETTSGTRPTTGYTKIPEVKSIPELNPEPDTLDSTTLEATEYRTYIAGLKDMGGSLGFTANLTQDSMDTWDAVVEAYNTAAAANKAMWFCVIVPGLTNALYFTGQPSPMGLPSMDVSAVLETTLYITPTGEPKWDAKPTSV
nr:MAG TPA: tail tube protein [Caudoviricetes sp.]